MHFTRCRLCHDPFMLKKLYVDFALRKFLLVGNKSNFKVQYTCMKIFYSFFKMFSHQSSIHRAETQGLRNFFKSEFAFIFIMSQIWHCWQNAQFILPFEQKRLV
jgi:hypothetical protein